ncbi:MAG: rhodanese-like domain-containing protein [Calothrix sp. MO_167.B12]|nr:rhodanese-like domain-containing protein [Calothrix sp. MO_167.B12]
MANADVHDIKSRLEWGQPACTIIDVRDRCTFNQGHIMGALPIDMEDLVNRARASLHTQRQIYVYGEDDQQAADAVRRLKSIGFTNVAEITGGLAAWKNAGGAVEGTPS